ncbi:MAG: response regulator transcription factor [Lachnospiraceae bacterium]|nr:response regulator transcription factor [Lachnospiraceae bacterium]
MKNVLIIEDNIESAQYLEKLVKQVSEDTHIFIAQNKSKAYEIAMENDITLMLVDIVLDRKVSNDISGIRFVEIIRKIDKYRFVPIIMITSLEDPKLYTYSELHVYGYVEKPYDSEYVKELVGEALKFPVIEEQKKKYYFRKDGIIYAVDLDEIMYIENKRKTVVFYTTTDNVTVPYIPIAKIMLQLNANQFTQCNRNCIINKNYVEMVDTINRFIKLKKTKKMIEIGITMKKKISMEFSGGL